MGLTCSAANAAPNGGRARGGDWGSKLPLDGFSIVVKGVPGFFGLSKVGGVGGPPLMGFANCDEPFGELWPGKLLPSNWAAMALQVDPRWLEAGIGLRPPDDWRFAQTASEI